MKITTDPLDDLMHVPTADPTYNESAYTSFADVNSRLGGFLRLGNRVNEGYAEVTVCIYLPDGRIAFWYTRASITDNEAHFAGGLRFDVAKELTEYVIEYAGPVVLLSDPAQMENPKLAFTSNPQAQCRVALRSSPVSPMILPWDVAGFATTHLEQNMAIEGEVQIGPESFELSGGYGIRDRSWGPRNWHHFQWYRWLTMSFGPDLGLALFVTRDSDGAEAVQGYVHYGTDREPQAIVSATIDTDYDERTYAQKARVNLQTSDGRSIDITGEVWSTMPLRHRKGAEIARLTEGMARWHTDGRDGVGLFEYFDQLVDGAPVGP